MRTLDQSLKHGSPVLRFENQGNTQYTRAIPLNWDPRQYGGDQDHPVIWDSLVLGKDLALNYQNLGPVAQYTTHLVLPSATTRSRTLQVICSPASIVFGRTMRGLRS